MIMDRNEDIEKSAFDKAFELNRYRRHNSTSVGDIAMMAFKAGVAWADEHPKEIEGCDFCKQLRGINHKSDECYLIYDGKTLYVDVDIPLSWGSATGYYGFDINFCPMCGRKLNEVENISL